MNIDSGETAQAETPPLHLPNSDEQRARYLADQAVRILPEGTLSHQQAADYFQASADVLRLHQLQQRVHAAILLHRLPSVCYKLNANVWLILGFSDSKVSVSCISCGL
jgi:hypothetical protein